jgi:hypothetical protein
MSNHNSEIQVSNAELASMVEDLHQINMDVSVPAMAEAAAWVTESVREEAEAADGLKGRRLGRRTFLLGAGAAAGGLALAACGSSTPSTTTSTTPTTSAASAATDLAVNALAASLEVQAVNTYGAAINAVVAGKFGKVPAAAVTFAETAKSQHAQHGAAWNAILVNAGKAKVTTGPSKGPYSDATINSGFAAIASSGNLVKLLQVALALENQAAQTYQVGSTVLTGPSNIALAASIQPVEMQHAAILYFVLGMYPGVQNSSGPISFNPTTSAAKTSYYTGPQ